MTPDHREQFDKYGFIYFSMKGSSLLNIRIWGMFLIDHSGKFVKYVFVYSAIKDNS